MRGKANINLEETLLRRLDQFIDNVKRLCHESFLNRSCCGYIDEEHKFLVYWTHKLALTMGLKVTDPHKKEGCLYGDDECLV